jgi:hypothetical protein
MPNVVFLHKPLAPDSRLGRVSEDGKFSVPAWGRVYTLGAWMWLLGLFMKLA